MLGKDNISLCDWLDTPTAIGSSHLEFNLMEWPIIFSPSYPSCVSLPISNQELLITGCAESHRQAHDTSQKQPPASLGNIAYMSHWNWTKQVRDILKLLWCRHLDWDMKGMRGKLPLPPTSPHPETVLHLWTPAPHPGTMGLEAKSRWGKGWRLETIHWTNHA